MVQKPSCPAAATKGVAAIPPGWPVVPLAAQETHAASGEPPVPFYSFGFVMALICAMFFYQAGEKETSTGLWWGGLSVILSAVVIMLLHGGVWSVLFAQVGLLVTITLYRVWRDPH